MDTIKEQAWRELCRGDVLPGFPTDALPDSLKLLVQSITKAYQVPEGMVAAFALGVISSALVGRVEIQPKANNPGYTEPVQVYILCQGASGERKTPVLRTLKEPLEEYLNSRRDAIRVENRSTQNRMRAIEQSLKKEKDVDKIAGLMDDKDRLEMELKPEPESLMGDVTMEALAATMQAHQGRAVLLHDEADFLMVAAGKSYQKEGMAVNLAAVLNGYTNEAYHGQRIGRGELHIPRASLSVCLGVQPGLLKKFMGDTNGADRGLHARFLYFLPESKIGKRTYDDTPVPDALRVWWDASIKRLAGLARETDKPYRIRFDAYAEAPYRKFAERIEKRLGEDLGGDIQNWGGKLVGNTVRVAGLLALLDGADVVGRKHWDSAETLCEDYFIPCAVRLFLGDNPALREDDRKLLDSLRGLDSDTFQEADYYRAKGRYVFKNDRNKYSLAISDLCLLGYIQQAANQPEYYGSGAKPSTIWKIHPDLHPKKQKPALEMELP